MAKYTKSSAVHGAWVKGTEVTDGTKAKLVSETNPEPSQFQNKDGSIKTQDVAKIRFQGGTEPLNISLNRTTLNGLIEAFGEDSKEWIGKVLTVKTEKTRIGGKNVTVVYLIPEGFEMKDDENGYAKVVKIGEETIQTAPSDDVEDLDPADIPF